jgi:hypothetical protein
VIIFFLKSDRISQLKKNVLDKNDIELGHNPPLIIQNGRDKKNTFFAYLPDKRDRSVGTCLHDFLLMSRPLKFQ